MVYTATHHTPTYIRQATTIPKKCTSQFCATAPPCWVYSLGDHMSVKNNSYLRLFLKRVICVLCTYGVWYALYNSLMISTYTWTRATSPVLMILCCCLCRCNSSNQHDFKAINICTYIKVFGWNHNNLITTQLAFHWFTESQLLDIPIAFTISRPKRIPQSVA